MIAVLPDFAPPSRVYRMHGHTVLALCGEIDIATAAEVVPHLEAVTAPYEPKVVIDLSAVTFFDCSGLRLLSSARRRVRARHGSLTVVCAHPFTLRILALSGLGPALRLVPTLEEAARPPATAVRD
ncbi:STAS domain-containing protein [Streptomyces sp. NPDC051597]|uniref:STAS domain-containing protein n=1 Tax=Streptomyces sp. NPDC051597 TaxID=3155049 RepID=UPI003430AB83